MASHRIQYRGPCQNKLQPPNEYSIVYYSPYPIAPQSPTEYNIVPQSLPDPYILFFEGPGIFQVDAFVNGRIANRILS